MRILVKGVHKEVEIIVDSPVNLLKLLQENDCVISAPCGGNGTCGKCRVEIEGAGSLLSCQTVISQKWAVDLGLNPDEIITVNLPDYGRAQISADGLLPETMLQPLLGRGHVIVDPASITDQRSDEQRFEDASGLKIPFYLLNQLSRRIRAGEQEIDFVFRSDIGQATHFLNSEQKENILGIAFDIGTTTMAAWLYNLETGDRLGVSSMYNPQRSFGADVISRIERIDNNPANLQIMQKQVTDALTQLSEKALASAGLKGSSIHYISISGNTTMMHILGGLDPSAIARSPFLPVSMSEQIMPASSIGCSISGDPVCLLLPSISAYTGADITAGILACGLFPADGAKKLLIDLGTNGEMVLSLPDGMTACSTAAGPAFEAANISCGMSGIAGAIDRVTIDNNKLSCTVIAGDKMKGVCGSGLISAIAALLKAGVIDETGRLTDETENLPADLAARFAEREGMSVFYLDRPDGEIYLSQKDIRELQNAKAAVAAGIMRLMSITGIKAEDLDEILLAGGFGHYLDVDDAYTIGLLPEGAKERTRAVGNTAGMGAIACLLNEDVRHNARRAAKAVKYIELSSDPEFTDFYIESMIFPDQE